MVEGRKQMARGMARLAEIIGPAPSELGWQEGLERLKLERQRIGLALEKILANPTATRTRVAKATRSSKATEPRGRKLTVEEKALEAKLQGMGLSLEQFAAMMKG